VGVFQNILTLHVFDCLALNGRSVVDAPFAKRYHDVRKFLGYCSKVRISENFFGVLGD
jgi:ATP-dependent DNA ligase